MDRYKILESIGEGGMGKVFKVFDYELGKECALKISKSDYSYNEAKRITKEASIWFKFRRIPQVVEVYEIINIDGKLGILMEWLEHGNIRKLIDNDDFTFEDRIVLLHDIISALKQCNETVEGFCHLDIKPENCLITKYKLTKLSDFGIASFNRKNLYTASMNDYNAGESILLTYKNESINIGTPLYMSPEQILGRCKDGRKSDIYSFGLMAFEILNKSHPIDSNNINEILKMQIEGIPDHSLLKVTLPESLFQTLRQCINTNIEQRPGLEDILTVLESFLSNLNKVKVRETLIRLPDEWLDALRKAYSYWSLGQRNEAIDILKNTLEEDPYNARAWLKLTKWIIEINPSPNDYIKNEVLRYVHRGLILLETSDKTEKEYWDKFIFSCVPSYFDLKTMDGASNFKEYLTKIYNEELNTVQNLSSNIKRIFGYGGNRCLCIKCGKIKWPIISTCPNCGFFPTNLRDIYNTFLLRLGNIGFEVEGDSSHQEAVKLRELRKLGNDIKNTIRDLEEDKEYELSLKKFVEDGEYAYYKSILEDDFDKTQDIFRNLANKQKEVPKEEIKHKENPKEKEVLYKAKVVGSLIEIDENGNRNDLYILPTAPGTQYKVGDYLFQGVTLNSEEEFHIAEQELSLLSEDDFNFEEKQMGDDKKKDTKKYEFELYGNKDIKHLKELIVKHTRERIKIIEPHFNEAILKWEENLYIKALGMNITIFRSHIWFEKVFSFIYLEGSTKYIEIAKLFSMPRKLYERFEKINKYYEEGLLKEFNL